MLRNSYIIEPLKRFGIKSGMNQLKKGSKKGNTQIQYKKTASKRTTTNIRRWKFRNRDRGKSVTKYADTQI